MKRRVETGTFIKLYYDGVSIAEIAEVLGISKSYVSVLSMRLRLPKRLRGGGLIQEVVHPKKVDPNSILATGGKYSLICKFAQKNGLTYTQAMQLWHRSRA